MGLNKDYIDSIVIFFNKIDSALKSLESAEILAGIQVFLQLIWNLYNPSSAVNSN